jgi:hypothetical protein
MMKRKRRLEIIDILAAIGVDKPELSDSCKHIRIEFTHNNRKITYFTGSTPSDWKANIRLKTDIKRMMHAAGDA